MSNEDAGLRDLVKQLDDIPETELNRAELEKANSEDVFNGLAVELLIETASLAVVATHIFPQGRMAWSRDQAIVGGHVVRLTKLIDAVLDQTCQHRRETTMVLTRMAMETIINLVFLTRNASDELFDSYVKYSFRHEKKLFDQIHAKVKARNGTVLPIERRMLSSIERKARLSGITLDQASSSRPKNWGDKNLFERAEAVGFEDAYLAVIGGPSHNVHGNWMDLLEYHLESENDYFIPKSEWSRPRPQILLAIAKLAIEAIGAYLDFIGHIEARRIMDARLKGLWERVREVDELHERYLGNRQGKT